MIPIKKGVPIPEKNNRYNRKYPFKEMEVGDMFEIPYDRTKHQGMYSAIRSFRLRNYSWKFVIRTNAQENWIRVWRIQ